MLRHVLLEQRLGMQVEGKYFGLEAKKEALRWACMSEDHDSDKAQRAVDTYIEDTQLLFDQLDIRKASKPIPKMQYDQLLREAVPEELSKPRAVAQELLFHVVLQQRLGINTSEPMLGLEGKIMRLATVLGDEHKESVDPGVDGYGKLRAMRGEVDAVITNMRAVLDTHGIAKRPVARGR
jgi:hypothetical protein